MEKKNFSGLMDIGADISVIWPSRWSYMETITQLQWIDQTQNTEQNSNELYWRDEEGQKGIFFCHTLFLTYM